jgi:CMP-N-acetylneuraminic acid synthetase
MGSILNVNIGSLISFEIIASDNSVPIEKIQLVSNKGIIINESKYDNVNIVTWKPCITVNNKESWYVVKVIHSNGKWGISSPIFNETVF